MADNHREQLIDAAMQLAAEVGPSRVRFSDIVEKSGVKRATAYRLFPGAYEGLLLSLHEELVGQTVREIRLAVRSVRRSDSDAGATVTFREALEQGMQAVLKVLRSARLTKDLIQRDGAFLSAYLLSRSPGSLYEVFADFSAGCAASFGSHAPDLPDVARRFVWGVLSDLVGDLQPGSNDDWPSDERLAEVLISRRNEFLAGAGLEKLSDDESRLERAIAPLADIPESFADLRFVVMSERQPVAS